MKTILAPIDFSEISDAVVKEAAALARSLDGRVILLTVVQPPVVVAEFAGTIDLAGVTSAAEKNARRLLGKIEEKQKNDFPNVTSIQVTGAPVLQIIEQAAECQADYIVMGSHSHTAVYDLLVGSTTHGVLKRANCPVVIVPASKELPRSHPEKGRVAVA